MLNNMLVVYGGRLCECRFIIFLDIFVCDKGI